MRRTWNETGVAMAIAALAVACSGADNAPASDERSLALQSGNRAWHQAAELLGKDGSSGDQMGSSVAISGNTAIAGASDKTVGRNPRQGAAYLFASADGGTWTEQQEVIASDGAALDSFGFSVAISGDVAVVGAIGKVVGANYSQGAAYVFTRSNGIWSQTQELIASDGAQDDFFGVSVAISDHTAAIGAQGASGGWVYIFASSGGGWTQTQKLAPSNRTSEEDFGLSIALAGDTLVAGAPYKTVGSNQVGAAYVFQRSAGSPWVQRAQLLASDRVAGDLFGLSVAVSGSNLVVGNPARTVSSEAYRGVAYIFAESGGHWSQVQRLQAGDGKAEQLFGRGVALSGNAALIGASGNGVGTGAAYFFTFTADGGTWAQTQELLGPANGVQFGYATALLPNAALIGAPWMNAGNNPLQGAAFVEVR